MIKSYYTRRILQRNWTASKTRQYLVHKGPFSLWEGNYNKIFDYLQIGLCVVVTNHPSGSDLRAELTDIQIFMERDRQSGLKMIDLETMVKSLRLAWLNRIFTIYKHYLQHVLKRFGGLFDFIAIMI